MVNQGWELLELSDAEQAAAEHTRRWPCMRPQSRRIRLPALTHAVTGFSTCGYRLQHIRLQAAAEETLAIRGYRLCKHETRTIHVKSGEHLIYENDEARRAPARPRRAPAMRTRDAHPGPA